MKNTSCVCCLYSDITTRGSTPILDFGSSFTDAGAEIAGVSQELSSLLHSHVI